MHTVVRRARALVAPWCGSLLAFCLAGCPFVGDQQYASLRDGDGDGFESVRFDGADCNDRVASINPDATEAWYDGVDQDCDGKDDFDQDGDGTVRADDCDDLDAQVFPGAEEICDGVDNDCDGLIDDDDTVPDDLLPAWFLDADGDDFGAGSPVRQCVAPPSHIRTDGDCDDNNADIAPDAIEVCDAADRNCDGDAFAGSIDTVGYYPDLDGDGLGDATELATLACTPPADFVDNNLDCDDGDVDATEAASVWFDDVDGDGFGDPASAVEACVAPAGMVAVGGDCNDTVQAIRPDAEESCNQRDDDCDGFVDEGAVDAGIFFLDGDGDGFGVEEVIACDASAGIALVGEDCDDTDALIRPGAIELCGDDVLQDCNASLDDCDGDGDLDAVDCDDDNPLIHSNATEVCDGLDNDCDGATDGDDDDVVVIEVQYFLDEDGDGFGSNTLVGAPSCTAPPNGVTQVGDCDDTNDEVFPGRAEHCDGLDNDCNDLVDDGQPADPPTFYRDTDLDGFGVVTEPFAQGCEAPGPDWALAFGDCDDTTASVNPEREEVCDGVDNDCDGLLDADDDGVELTVWFLDQDSDGVGLATQTVEACTRPLGYAPSSGDCDDTNPLVSSTLEWFRDDDNDGRGDDNATVTQCGQPTGFVDVGGDCNDDDGQIRPGALEVCDGIDNDCDGGVDDEDEQGSDGNTPWFRDVDQDGFGDREDVRFACLPPTGYVASSTDCDDVQSDVNPGAVELCNDEDDDCDQVVDDNAPPDILGFRDVDQDGFGDDTQPVVWCSFSGAPTLATTLGGDCNDAEALVRPDADEICDGLDNDCDLLVDDAPLDGTIFKADRDGDGAPSSEDALACSVGFDDVLGFALRADPGIDYDCDDADPTVFFGAPELCDGLDNDCDGDFDEEPSPGDIVAFADNDGDGFGDPLGFVQVCVANIPSNVSLNNADCNDDDERVILVNQSLAVGSNRAFTTIQSAVDEACEGQELLIDPGVYLESVSIDRQLQLVARRPEFETKIDGGSGTALSFIDVSGSLVNIEGLELVSEGIALELTNTDASVTDVEINGDIGLLATGDSVVVLLDTGVGTRSQSDTTGIETQDTAQVAMIGGNLGVPGPSGFGSGKGLRAFGSSHISTDGVSFANLTRAVFADDDAHVELSRTTLIGCGGGNFSQDEFGGGGVVQASGQSRIDLFRSEISGSFVILPPLGFFSPFGSTVFLDGGSFSAHQSVFRANYTELFAGSSGTLDLSFSTLVNPKAFSVQRLFDLDNAVTGTVSSSILVDNSSSGNAGGLVFDDNLSDGVDYGGTGVRADPLFWRAHLGCEDRWDLHILAASPAVDSGGIDLYGYTAGPDNPEEHWNRILSSFNGVPNTVEAGWGTHFLGIGDAPRGDDADGDGLDNAEEVLLGTDPTRVDTDADGADDPSDTENCAY